MWTVMDYLLSKRWIGEGGGEISDSEFFFFFLNDGEKKTWFGTITITKVLELHRSCSYAMFFSSEGVFVNRKSVCVCELDNSKSEAR